MADPPGARHGEAGRRAGARAPARPSVRRRVKFAAYQGLRLSVNTLLRALAGFRVSGWRNMPRGGPVLVVSNHLHNFDPIVLSAAVPRPVFYMAKRELFANARFGWLIRNLGAFPVDRGAPDRAALRQALALLDEGLVVGFFPEGTRSLTGALGAAHPGVALVAVRSGAPILPVAITGTEALPLDAKAAGRANRGRPRVRVTVGAPFHLPPRPAGEKPDLAAATERIMREIAALLPPAYRGGYGDEPAGGDARGEGRGARGD